MLLRYRFANWLERNLPTWMIDYITTKHVQRSGCMIVRPTPGSFTIVSHVPAVVCFVNPPFDTITLTPNDQVSVSIEKRHVQIKLYHLGERR